MKKLLLLIILVVVMAFNYKLVSFDYGFVQIPTEESNVVENIALLLDVNKIEYYDFKVDFLEGDKIIIVYTDNNGSVLYQGNDDTITGLNLLGILSNEHKPTKVEPFSYFIYLGIAVLILVIPMSNKKTK